MQQLPLSISLRDDATFGNFYPSGENTLVVKSLEQLNPGGDYHLAYLCGLSGCGRSHLLQAVCHQFPDSVYLPMAELSDYEPDEVFAALEHQALVCLDDIDSVAGAGNWEEALFHFLNRKMLLGGVVLVSAGQLAEGLFALPDLVSRLQQGLVLRLSQPGDEDKARIFSWRGRRRGMHIPQEVTNFVLRHYGRDLRQLMRLLDELDVQSLEQKRRVTVPFVRELIESMDQFDLLDGMDA